MDRTPDRNPEDRSGPDLYRDDDHKKELQIRNGFLQYDEVVRLISRSAGQLCLSPQMILDLHRLAIEDIYQCAGKFREWSVTIKGSQHKPPESRFVIGLVDAMCEVASESVDWNPLKVCAYLIWRLNWIHPFGGGNGRTARAIGNYALCVRLGMILPGNATFADRINQDRSRYQAALVDADKAWAEQVIDVSKMEFLIDDLLRQQLAYLDESSN